MHRPSTLVLMKCGAHPVLVHSTSCLQVEQAQQELERRQAAAEAQAEELAARERSLRRQEDGLEGLKVRSRGEPSP